MLPIILNKLNYWQQEVGSDQFCFIINSPWLYIFTLYIFLYPLIYYYYKSMSLFYYSLSISSFYIFYSLSLYIYFFITIFSYLLLLLLLLLLGLYLGDLLRELYSKYELYYIVLFLVFFVFILSETLLFVSFFWTSFHSFLSTFIPYSYIFLPSPILLTFTNTILLSNSGLSLGSSFICLEITSSYYLYYSILSFIHGILFIFILILR